jgi:hypothetical protein
MRRVLLSAVVAGSFLFAFGGVAVADPTGSVIHPGQHNQSCGLGLAITPPGGGNSIVSPGSPFNGGTSASNYAGQQPQNRANGQNSQYDVACFQQTSH